MTDHKTTLDAVRFIGLEAMRGHADNYRRLAAVPACGHSKFVGTCALCHAAKLARQTRDGGES